MKKPVYLILLIFFIVLRLMPAQNKILVVTDEWAPYVFLDDEKIRGFDYEIMDAVFRRMGVDYEFRIIPWQRCLHMIETGEADAILDVSFTEERADFIIYPEEPISYSESVLFHRKGAGFSILSLEDLRGYTIGTIRGYAYGEEFREADYLTLEPVKTIEQNIRKVLLGRIELFISNRNVGLYTAKQMGALDDLDNQDLVISSGENYLAFSNSSPNRDLAEAFSHELKRFRETDEFRHILAEYGQ